MSGQARVRGVAVDEADVPTWAAAHLSPDQLRLNRGLLWILLLYKCHGLDQSRYNVAQRLYVHTVGKDYKRVKCTLGSLTQDLECSDNTARDSIKDLEERGFLLVRRHGNGSHLYQLAWPVEDTTQPVIEEPIALCGAPKKNGGTCTWRAGRGTMTPGVGPCKQHGGEPRNPDPIPQPLRDAEDEGALFTPQPLRDDAEADPSTIEEPHLNHCGTAPQPLRADPSMVEDIYVRGSLKSSLESSSDPVLAVGELTVRTARATEPAPAAQPENLTARAIIAAIPRYRAAPAWVRKHLIALATHALQGRLSREVIIQYASQVIAERTYADQQHIPEFRGALRRLATDVALGSTCRQCGGDPSGALCCTDPATDAAADRPWTAEDQAKWELILDQLGVTPDELDPAGSA